MNRLLFIVVSAVIVFSSVAPAQSEITINSLPPVVVSTYPKSGDHSVDPSIKEIRVTFSKDMMTEQMWSWVEVTKGLFPPIAGDVRYLKDKRTCVLPVKLEPNKTYAIWINSQNHNSFRDTDQNPAVPYLLVFHTGN